MVLPPRPRKSRWGARAAAVGEAREFCRGILGMTEATKPIGLAARGGCRFEDGELKVHLGIEKNFVPARRAHPAYLVDGLAALEAALKKAGRPIVHGEPVDGYARLFARNPFGSRIELMQIKAGWPLRCFGPATASIDLASDRDNVPNDAEADAKKEQ